MYLFAIAVPVLPDQADRFQRLIDDINGARKEGFRASRVAMGVRERTFLQHSPMGDLVVVTLEGDDPAAAFASFGQGSDPFTAWFKAEVEAVHGVDLSAPPAYPLPELVVDTGAL
jgi:hypothetical protein